MTLKNILTELQSSTKPMEYYLKKIPEGLYRHTDELINLIENELVRSKNEEILEYLLLIAQRDGLNKSYTKIFCDLLKETWHFSHEDIVMYLEDIQDPQSIDCIYNVSFWELDYDDGKSLAKKCIWALGNINTPEALAKIKLLSDVNNPIISETALLELKRRVR